MKIEPNPAALEAMARAAYEREAEQHPVQWAVATWEQLAPTMREKWVNAAASFLQPYLNALPNDTSLQELLKAHQMNIHTWGCACGWENDWNADQLPADQWAKHLAALVGTREAPPAAPPGADQILKILEHHNYRTHTTPRSMGYWIHCACGWHSTGQKPEGYDFTPEHHAHLAQELAALIEKGNTP